MARSRPGGDGTDYRLFAVAAWRGALYFNAAERATLVLAEAVTWLSDRPNLVPDPVWDEAARHYDERALATLVRSARHERAQPAQRRHPADRQARLLTRRGI